ncbi:DNA-dependent protein kinase subunit [Planoprotostelium fungivorum]|uniref:DNA-dependent protein kinase catalytic subunit n=1 Tax=Planoprotostelium fungivorum TaxID=1890364 RepID=A0A2P6MVV9_9EUKA|nr:DNA-dependent protein kinase subunit [Planoprotostelium fungivorum]
MTKSPGSMRNPTYISPSCDTLPMNGENHRHLEILLAGIFHLLGPNGETQGKKDVTDAPAMVDQLTSECTPISEAINSSKDFEGDVELISSASMISSLLFVGNHSLLKIVSLSYGDQEKHIIKTKESLFKLLKNWLKTIGIRARDYAQDIREVCYQSFRREQSNSVRIAALKALVKLFTLHLKTLEDGEKSAVVDMSSTIYNEYVIGKSSQTVKGLMLEALGLFARQFPKHMNDKIGQMTHIFLENLQRQFKSHKPDMQLISGSLSGLRHFIFQFSDHFVKDTKNVQQLYHYVTMALNPPPQLVRYDIPKAALDFISSHGSLFRQYLTQDAEKMFQRLFALCKHQNKKLRSKAFAAYEVFIIQVSFEITSGSRNSSSDEATFRFFIRSFYEMLESSSSRIYEVSTAIRGLGYMADPICQFMGQNELKKMLSKLVTMCQRFYSGGNESMEEQSAHLASFISAFASIILQETYLTHFEAILGTVFRIYPDLYFRDGYCLAISRLIIALCSKGTSLQSLLDRVIYQALLITCSVRPRIDGEELEQPYMAYLSLWKSMLDLKVQTNEREASSASSAYYQSFSKEAKEEISKTVYNSLMGGMILFIQKVELASIDKMMNGETVQQDTTSQTADYALFLNFVEFTKLILSTRMTGYMVHSDWMYLLAKEIILKSHQCPRISGFYKLFTTLLNASREHAYFSTTPDDIMVTEEREGKIRMCSVLFSRYIKEVIGRIDQFKDELLSSCIQLVLSSPHQVVPISQLIPAMRAAFRFGLNYIPLAKIGIDTMKRWISDDYEQMKVHLSAILPLMEAYLLINVDTSTSSEQDNNSTAHIQEQVLRLLGKLGGDNIYMITDSDHDMNKGIAWDDTKRVRFTLPFPDVKVDLYVDSTLARIVELSTNANDPQTKTAAAELLHGILLYMLGTNTKSEDHADHSYRKLYDHLFPALLRLASDPDPVCRQLFEPLTMQLIHYHTRPNLAESEDTSCLLEAVSESLSSRDAALRDTAGKCVSEFIKWSVKHSSKKQMESNVGAVKGLFKRLFGLSRHPNPYKRLGSILAIESSMEMLKSESALVDQFAMEILHHMIVCIRLCRHDDWSLGVAEKAERVIDQLGEVIASSAKVLVKVNRKRREHEDLRGLVEWLLMNIGRQEMESRRVCMSTFTRLSVCLPGIHTTEQCVRSFSTDQEGTTMVLRSIQPYDFSRLRYQLENPQSSVSQIQAVLEQLYVALDTSIWALQSGFGELLIQEGRDSHRSMLLCADLYLRHWATKSTDDAVFARSTPSEMIGYHQVNYNILLSLCRFTSLQMKLSTKDNQIISQHYLTLVLTSILSPHMLGSTISDINQIDRMRSTAVQVIVDIHRCNNSDVLELLKRSLEEVLSQPKYDITAWCSMKEKHFVEMSNVIIGMIKLDEATGLITQVLPRAKGQTLKRISHDLLSQVFDSSQVTNPLEQNYGSLVLQLCNRFDVDTSDVVDKLFDATIIQGGDQLPSLGTMELGSVNVEAGRVRIQSMTRGEEFYVKYHDALDKYTLEHRAVMARVLASKIAQYSLAVRIVLSVSHIASKLTHPFLHELFRHSNQLMEMLSSPQSTHRENAVQLARQIIQNGFVKDSSEGLQWINYLLNKMMSRSIPLSLKMQVIELLPGICVNQKMREGAKEMLLDMVVYDFPVSSKELPVGSAAYTDYISAIDKILSSLEISISDRQGLEVTSMFLEALFPALSEMNHSHFGSMSVSIEKAITSCDSSSACQLFASCFSHFIMESLQDQLRLHLVDLFCIPLIKRIHSLSNGESMVGQLFAERISTIIGILNHTINTSDDEETKKTWMTKKISYIAYRILDPQTIREIMNRRFSGEAAKGNELTASVMRLGHNAKCDPHLVHSLRPPRDDASNEDKQTYTLFRNRCFEYQCSAFNALAAVVSRTQTKENFYSVFFFRENRDKGEHDYKLEVETNFSTVKRTVGSTHAESYTETESRQKRSLINFLADSSLTQELGSSTTFLGKISRTATPTLEKMQNPAVPDVGSPAKEELVELDEINQHPCMSVMLDLLDHMYKLFQQDFSKEVPKFMQEMHSKLSSKDSSPNTLLFILKTIVNRPLYFKAYSSYWIGAIIQALNQLFVSGTANKESVQYHHSTAGKTINYCMRDICTLIIEWNVKLDPKDSFQANILLNHLAERCSYPDRNISRYNVSIVKSMIEQWKDYFIPSKVCHLATLSYGLTVVQQRIVEMLADANTHTKITALQLLAVFVLNGFPIYHDEQDTFISKVKYMDLIMSNLFSEEGRGAKELYTTTAEVVAMQLALQQNDKAGNSGSLSSGSVGTQSASQRSQETEDVCEQMFRDKLNTIFSKGDYDRYINCMERIDLQAPFILIHHYPRIFQILPRVNGDFKTVALQLILDNVEHITDVVDKLKPELIRLMSQKNDAAHDVSFKILIRMLKAGILGDNDIKPLLEAIVKSPVTRTTSQVKNSMYELMELLYEKDPLYRSGEQDLTSQLIMGLSNEESISNRLLLFWDRLLPEKSSERLYALFQAMYTPDTETHWIHYSTLLLMKLTARSPDYDRLLFDRPLSDAPYREINIETNQHSSMTVGLSQSPFDPRNVLAPEFVRATVLTDEESPSMSFTPGSLSSLFGASMSKQRPAVSRKEDDKTEASPFIHPSQFVKPSLDKSRKRFFKMGTPNRSQQMEMIRLKNKQQQIQAARQARKKNLVILRKYRAGELPDIQIKSRDILDPLMFLVKKDSNTAQSIMAHIFAILSQDAKQDMDLQYRGIIDRIFKTSSFTGGFCNFMLNICYHQNRIMVSAPLISNCALKSYNFHAGIMLLEKQLSYSQNLGGKTEDRGEWAELMKLYRALGDVDTRRGIFENKIAHTDISRQAIAAEYSGNYLEALAEYERGTKLLDEGARKGEEKISPSTAEIDIWENNRLECFTMLNRWDDLYDNTMVEVEQRPQELYREGLRDPYLYYYVISSIKSKNRWEQLWQFISTSFEDKTKRGILESEYLKEMAFVAVTQNDFDRGRYYVSKFWHQFMSLWSKLQSFDFQAKQIQLQQLQNVVELEEFLEFVSREAHLENTTALNTLMDGWLQRYPSSEVDPLTVWDNIVTNRGIYMEKIHERQSSTVRGQNEINEHKLSELKEILIDKRSKVYREIADAARKQNNLYVSEAYLRNALKSKSKKKEFDFDCFRSLVKLHNKKALDSKSLIETADKLTKALKFVQNKEEEEIILNNKSYQSMFTTLQANVLAEVSRLSLTEENVVREAIDKNQWQWKPTGENISNELYKKALEYHVKASHLAKEACSGSQNKMYAKSQLKLALFSDEMIKSGSKDKELGDHVVRGVVDAMIFEYPSASDYFPRLLEITGSYPSSNRLFSKLIREIPTWQFIRWTPQIIALLGSDSQGDTVLPILVSLAEKYPQSIYYSYKISSEDDSLQSPAMQKRLEPLNKILKDELIDDFISSLQKLTHPEHRFKDWGEILKSLLKASKRSQQAIKSTFAEIYADLLDSTDETIGSYNKKFATTWSRKVTSAFGKDGANLCKMTAEDLQSHLSEFLEPMNRDLNPKKTAKMKLVDFSSWLQNFEQLDRGNGSSIEIPGQYSGTRIPVPSEHVKITGFDASVLVMGSLRKPKRVKMLGDNEKEYPFLVKGGEDLRLDQRIQQLFSVTNRILERDPACMKRKLSMKTYSVVPMTSKVGIIEWIENTKPLKEIMEEQLAKDTGKPKADTSILKTSAAAQQDAWVKSFGSKVVGKKRLNPCDYYYAMFQHANRAETDKQFTKHAEGLPSDLLKRGLFAASASMETYLGLRSQFAKTLSVFSVASYLIGIGDRHLENFLFSFTDGSLIGIDFGHAFGTATQFLPIPELMPFRLTRQFIGLLSPLDADGFLKFNMTYTLEALQNGKEKLLNTMDVFIREPLIDWERLAKRVAKDQGGDDSSQAWFPKKKIEIAKKKLQGENPAHITALELKESVHANAPYLPHLQQIVMGSKTHNIRARVGTKCSSAKEQVDCLVDQATDSNILGRSWFGWAPWM